MKTLPLLTGLAALAAASRIDRERLVRAANPRRAASSDETPLQVGNGNFAFGADVTGLQTFRPFATMATWGWHSFALPEEDGQRSPEGMFDGALTPCSFPRSGLTRLLTLKGAWRGLRVGLRDRRANLRQTSPA